MRCHKCGKKGHWRIECTEELCSRCHGRRHAADVCTMSKEEAGRAASDDDDDYDTVEALAFKAGETGECSNVSGKRGKGSRLAGRGWGLAYREWSVYSHDAFSRWHNQLRRVKFETTH